MGVNQSSNKNYTNERTPLYIKARKITTNHKRVHCPGCNKSIKVKSMDGFRPIIEGCGKVEHVNDRLFTFAHNGKQHSVKLIRAPSTA